MSKNIDDVALNPLDNLKELPSEDIVKSYLGKIFKKYSAAEQDRIYVLVDVTQGKPYAETSTGTIRQWFGLKFLDCCSLKFVKKDCLLPAMSSCRFFESYLIITNSINRIKYE